jgi:hypothetical protein
MCTTLTFFTISVHEHFVLFSNLWYEHTVLYYVNYVSAYMEYIACFLYPSMFCTTLTFKFCFCFTWSALLVYSVHELMIQQVSISQDPAMTNISIPYYSILFNFSCHTLPLPVITLSVLYFSKFVMFLPAI